MQPASYPRPQPKTRHTTRAWAAGSFLAARITGSGAAPRSGTAHRARPKAAASPRCLLATWHRGWVHVIPARYQLLRTLNCYKAKVPLQIVANNELHKPIAESTPPIEKYGGWSRSRHSGRMEGARGRTRCYPPSLGDTVPHDNYRISRYVFIRINP
jgi:hypothetical protein